MVKKNLLSMTLIAILATGCQNEDLVEASAPSVLRATVEANNPISRVGFDKDVKFYWSQDDKMQILHANGCTFVTINNEDAGKNAASFTGSGVIEGYAVYPYDSKENAVNHSLSGTQLTYNFPPSYTYDKVDETWYVTEQGTGVSFNPAMAGAISDAKTVFLSHLGGVFAISINPMPVAEGKLVFSTSHRINGNYTYDLSQLGTKGIEALKATTEAEKEVTINFTGATVGKKGVFYIPVPVGNYTCANLKIISEGDTKLNIQDAGAYNISRQMIYGYIIEEGKLVAGGETEDIATQDDADKSLKSMENATNPMLNVNVTGADVTTWNLPESFTKDDNTNSELNITYTVAPKSIKITQHGATATSASGKSRGQLTLTLPGVHAEGTTIEVLTPNMTVKVINGGESLMTITSVTALTGGSTFTLGETITVGTLTANGGKVAISKGAKVTELAVSAAYSNTVASIEINGTVGTLSTASSHIELTGKGNIETAIKDTRSNNEEEPLYIAVVGTSAEGGTTEDEQVTLPPTVPDNIVTLNSSEEMKLRKALEDGTEYALQDDLKLTAPLVISKAFTLDLGTFSIIPEGTALEAVAGSTTTDALIVIKRGGKLTLNGDGKIDTGNNSAIYSAIKLLEKGEEATNGTAELLINNNPTVKGYYYAIAGNGMRHNTKITIENGTYGSYSDNPSVTEAGLCIYHPQDGTLTINNGTFEGFASAVEMRAGTLNIKNGTFSSTATPANKEENGSGSTMYGTAIAISQHKTDLDLSVNISGGTFTGINALVEEDLENATGTEKIKLSITAGTFNGEVSSANCNDFIAGGIFNHPSVLHYLATDAKQVTIDALGKTFEMKNLSISGNPQNIALKNAKLNFAEEGNAAIELATKNTTFALDNVTLTVAKAEKVLVCGSNETTTVGNTININASTINNTATNGSGIQLKNNHTLTLTASNITHDYFGITQNGNHTGSAVSVTGGSISGQYTGIYLSNQEAGKVNTLTVDGCKITSTKESPIEVKKTNITVKNSTLKSEATTQSYTFSAGGSGGVGYGIVLAAYEEGRLYEGDKDLETNNTFDLAAGADAVEIYEYAGKPITTAAELKEYLEILTDANSGDGSVIIEKDITLNEGENWTPITVDGYSGAGIITVHGNNHTIKGLNAPLFKGGFAGASGIVINDLTIEGTEGQSMLGSADMGATGSGVFIESIDAMPTITLNNCHVKNVDFKSEVGSRVGGLIGYIAGYNGAGSVLTTVKIEGCSVTDCTFTTEGSLGGIIGHAGGNPNTDVTINNCTITNCTLNSTDDGDWRVGVVIGTVGCGKKNEISNITESGNTLTQTGKTAPEGQSNLYGRFAPNGTGKLTIDNKEITIE